jgi:membrane protease YdiL (CAAX protease family)
MHVDRDLRPLAFILAMVVAAGIMIFAYCVLVRVVEQRWPLELATRGFIFGTGGTLVGIALFVVLYAVLWMLGVASLHGVRGFDGVALILGLSIISGVAEELVVRGGVFRPLEGAFGTVIALIVSGALFGIFHASNPSATIVSTVSIAVEAGLLLGLAYTATRGLWFPIGIHFGWNFAEGGIFSATVSGFRSNGILDVPLSGPEILTGGAFGPEASVVSVVVCLVGAGLIGWAAIRAGRWYPLRFAVRSGP